MIFRSTFEFLKRKRVAQFHSRSLVLHEEHVCTPGTRGDIWSTSVLSAVEGGRYWPQCADEEYGQPPHRAGLPNASRPGPQALLWVRVLIIIILFFEL